MSEPVKSYKILKTINAIRSYIGGDNPISRDQCKEFIRMGMPACQIGTTWFAHADNIDNWFRDKTNVTWEGVSDDRLDVAE